MAEQNKKKKNTPRQDWDPHWVIGIAYKVWKVIFVALKVIAGAAATVLLIGVVCAFVFVGIVGDYLQEDILPMADMDMEDYDHEQNSNLYYLDENGQIQVYQQVFAETSSQWAAYEDIPEDLINAAVAIEDHRFNEHQGVDWITTVKACARMFFGDDSVGGSSITQQLIKNILLADDETADDVTVQRKVLEIFRAVQLERRYDKETIMEMYLNVIYLGQGCRGVRSAASTYFGKELEMLTTAECASLISITNNPSLFDPYGEEFMYKPAGEDEGRLMTGKERNRNRQLIVLGAMKEYEMLTQEEYQAAVAQEMVFKSGIEDGDRMTFCPNESCQHKDIRSNFKLDGETYYCPECNTLTPVTKNESQDNYSWFTDTVLEDVARALAEQNEMTWNESTQSLVMQQIQRGGYHIFTTLDLKVQNQMDAIYTNLDEIPDARSGQQLQSAGVVIDNRTGDIVALCGGVGEKEGFDDWNRATDAKLQSGSSIKPLSVYAPAFELGAITPASVVKDLPLTYTNGAYPLNDNREYHYARTIFSGVTSSVNAMAAQTLMLIGEQYSYEFSTQKFGLSSLVEQYVDDTGYVHSDIGVGPLAMGAQTWGVRVRDMANAFATFANDGIYRKARTFTKVYDSDGNLVLDNTQKTEQILSKKTVDYMNYCLVSATQSGTGYNADMSWSSGITTAGKTGTTGDSKDRWYCGFTGYYTMAVWCGFDTPEVIYGISGNPAAQLFKKVLEPLHKGKENVSLYDKDALVGISVCLDSGKLATDACKQDIRTTTVALNRVSSAGIYSEDIPSAACDKHVLVDYCTTGGGVATEYCKEFAKVDKEVKIEKKSLVKLTKAKLDEILQAGQYNLDSAYLRDEYVYFVNDEGKDAEFHGFAGDINKGIVAPYKVCTAHTQEAWNQQQTQDPTAPTVPGTQTTPNTPTTPAAPNGTSAVKPDDGAVG